MYIIDDAINSLCLGYEVEYSIISTKNKELIDAQKKFHSFLSKRKQDNCIIELEENNIDKRVYPNLLLENAKSIIVFLFAYLSKEHKKNGNLSVYTQSIDYHINVREKLNNIVEHIKKTYNNANFYTQVDSGALNEKFFAYHSGVGSLGINSLIFSKIYGSFVNIGVIVTDIGLEEKIYEKSNCINCMKCLNACPSKAITKDYVILSDRCISYITQKKEELSNEEILTLKKTNKIFGCDICQNICPLNSNVKYIEKNYDIISDITEKDLEISAKEFKRRYKDRAFSFRGKKVLLRNLEVLKSEQV